MYTRPTVALRYEPHMLPALAAAYDDAANEMSLLLIDVQNRGRINEPWTADPVSVAMTEHYNDVTMEGEYSTFAALKYYLQELISVRDHLTAMEAAYRSTEGANADLWVRRA